MGKTAALRRVNCIGSEKTFDARKTTLIIESEETAPIHLPINESTLTDALIEGVSKMVEKAKEEITAE